MAPRSDLRTTPTGSTRRGRPRLWQRGTGWRFPTDDAVLKILYLAIRNIGHQRGGDLGTGTQRWKQALNAFAIAFP